MSFIPIFLYSLSFIQPIEMAIVLYLTFLSSHICSLVCVASWFKIVLLLKKKENVS